MRSHYANHRVAFLQGLWTLTIVKLDCGLNLGSACKEHSVRRGNRSSIPSLIKDRIFYVGCSLQINMRGGNVEIAEGGVEIIRFDDMTLESRLPSPGLPR